MDEVSSHVCLVLPSTDGKAARKIVPPRLRIPYWKGLGADSEEKHEPVSDIDTVVVDSLKALDPKRPIREADMLRPLRHVRFVPRSDIWCIAGTRGRLYPDVKAPGTCRSPVFAGGADSIGWRLRSRHFERPRAVFREAPGGIRETSSSKVFASC